MSQGQILDAIGPGQAVTARALARRTGLHPATVRHHLAALEAGGRVRRYRPDNPTLSDLWVALPVRRKA